MLIDWFTVIAQIINFLILLWLLKKFLFKPILKAVEERQDKIRRQMKEAEEQMERAEASRVEFHAKEKQFDAQRAALMSDTVESAKLERKALLSKMRDEAEALRMQLQKSMQDDHRNSMKDVKDRTKQEVIAITRKIMSDLGNTSFENQVIEMFIKKINTISGKPKELLLKAFAESTRGVRIRTGIELDQDQKSKISHAVTAHAGLEIPCSFQIIKDGISGIEMSVHGYKLSWTVEDYLTALEKKLLTSFDGDANLPASPN